MKVTIRPLEKEDAYISYKWRNDPEVFKYTGNTYTNEISLETELDWISKVIQKMDDYRCAIVVDDVYIGNIYLTDIKDGKANYHIFIGNRGYWGKGVAKEASRLIIDYGFATLGLNRILLKVRPQNITAYNLYLRLGFQETSRDDQFIEMQISKDAN